MLIHSRPSSTASANAPVHRRTPASASSSATEAAASLAEHDQRPCAPRSRATARARARARRPSGRSSAPARTAAASRRCRARRRTRRAAARPRAGARAPRAAARCPRARGRSARPAPPPRRARRARAAARRRAASAPSSVRTRRCASASTARSAAEPRARSRGRRRSRASEKRCGAARPNGSATASGPVDELVAVAEQGDADAVAGQPLDGERAFEGGGSAAGDEQMHGPASYGTAARRPPSGRLRVRAAGFPQSQPAVAPDARGAAAHRACAMPTNVLIAGGGPAALEAALALHRLAGERVSTTLLAPETEPHLPPAERARAVRGRRRAGLSARADGRRRRASRTCAAGSPRVDAGAHTRRRPWPASGSPTTSCSSPPARGRSSRSRGDRVHRLARPTRSACTASSRTSRAATCAGSRSSCRPAAPGRCRSTSSR